MEYDLLRRAMDLAHRAEKLAAITNSGFLTPADQHLLESYAEMEAEPYVIFHGGAADCERKCAFFLPSWEVPEALDPAQSIDALHISAAFGTPGHRDYLGALLALGIKRDCLGDLRIVDNQAYLFCLANIADYLVQNLEQVGRCGVTAARVPLTDVPALERRVKKITFTVQSPRLDSICGAMFGLSRTAANARILQGSVTVNYVPCLKPDATIHPGDVISLRGRGKGTLSEIGGTSRKGRQFLSAEIWE